MKTQNMLGEILELTKKDLIVIYDAYEGLIMEKLSKQKVKEKYNLFIEKFFDNFYFRSFNEDFDYIFVNGIEYCSQKKGAPYKKVFLDENIKSSLNSNSIYYLIDENMPHKMRYLYLEGDSNV